MAGTKERRAAPRHDILVDVKFLLRDKVESVGALLDISAHGLALLTDVEASEGDTIVVYPVGLGRLPGQVARKFEGGLGVALTLSPSQRDSLEKRIAAALSGATYLKLTERRSALRVKYNIETMAHIVGGEAPFSCTIIDMSRTGCLLHTKERPEIGAEISVGALTGIVARHMEDGFGVEFKVKTPRRADNAAERAA